MKFSFYEKTLLDWAKSNWWPEIKKLRLSLDDSTFSYLYKAAEEDNLNWEPNYNCLVAFDNTAEKPVAIAMYEVKKSELEFMVFVQENYRRNKLGTQLFNKIKNKTKTTEYCVYPHDHASEKFFNKICLESVKEVYNDCRI